MSHGVADETVWAQGGAGATPFAPTLYLFPALRSAGWWRALLELRAHLNGQAPAEAIAATYADLLGELAVGGHRDLRWAAATELLRDEGPLSAYAAEAVPAGLLHALEKDLSLVHHLTAADPALAAAQQLGHEPPALADLATPRGPGLVTTAVEAVLAALAATEPRRRVELFVDALARYGSGEAALYDALVWQSGTLTGVPHPDRPDWGELFGLEEQLGRLERNVEALLQRAGAHHALLYGARGSGKSTAVRGLLRRFAGRGLKLVEVPPAELHALAELVEALRRQPTSFVLYVDDLAFDEGESAYRPLKSLLEGSLARRPSNVMVVATSNRRHLVKERLSERPQPEDDVHGWDTHNERLALADRFGLTITFPSGSQRQYLELVRALAALRGVADFSQEQAIKFAEWGNGYSGRTARQFVDELRQDAAGDRPAAEG